MKFWIMLHKPSKLSFNLNSNLHFSVFLLNTSIGCDMILGDLGKQRFWLRVEYRIFTKPVFSTPGWRLSSQMSLIYAERKVCYLLKSLFPATKLEWCIKGRGRVSLKSHFKISLRATILQTFLLNRRQSTGSGSVFCFFFSIGRWWIFSLLWFLLIQKIHLDIYAHYLFPHVYPMSIFCCVLVEPVVNLFLCLPCKAAYLMYIISSWKERIVSASGCCFSFLLLQLFL